LQARPAESGGEWPPQALVSPEREQQLHRHVVGIVLAPPFKEPVELEALLRETLKKQPPSVFPPVVTRKVVEAAVAESEKSEAHMKQLGGKLNLIVPDVPRSLQRFGTEDGSLGGSSRSRPRSRGVGPEWPGESRQGPRSSWCH